MKDKISKLKEEIFTRLLGEATIIHDIVDVAYAQEQQLQTDVSASLIRKIDYHIDCMKNAMLDLKEVANIESELKKHDDSIDRLGITYNIDN